MVFTEKIEGLYTIQCDLNLAILKKSADEMYQIIKHNFSDNTNDHNGATTLVSQLYSKYNFLMYPLPGIQQLYKTISFAFYNCLNYYHKENPPESEYFIQCWLNYYRKGEYLNWHSHTKNEIGAWHGFYCLDVEPNSYTSYSWPKDLRRKDMVLDIESKNNLIVLGISNDDLHKSSAWHDDSRPRITIAFDIIPQEQMLNTVSPKCESLFFAVKHIPTFKNHWIPI